MTKLIYQGVYRITHIPTKDTYIGSSYNVAHRFEQHISTRFRWFSNSSREDYMLELLKEVPDIKDLKTEEYLLINQLKPTLNKEEHPSGHNNNSAVGSKSQYESVFKLGSKGIHYKDIAREVELSEGIVKSILNGQSHKYLQDKFPELYRKILILKRKLIILKHDIHGVVEFKGSIKEFETKFKVSGIGRVLSGIRKSSHGWTLVEEDYNDQR